MGCFRSRSGWKTLCTLICEGSSTRNALPTFLMIGKGPSQSLSYFLLGRSVFQLFTETIIWSPSLKSTPLQCLSACTFIHCLNSVSAVQAQSQMSACLHVASSIVRRFTPYFGFFGGSFGFSQL